MCKHIKKIRSSQPAIPVMYWVKHEWVSLTNFYKRVHLLLKRDMCEITEKKISLFQIMHLKLTFLSPDNQQLLLVGSLSMAS